MFAFFELGARQRPALGQLLFEFLDVVGVPELLALGKVLDFRHLDRRLFPHRVQVLLQLQRIVRALRVQPFVLRQRVLERRHLGPADETGVRPCSTRQRVRVAGRGTLTSSRIIIS